MRNLAIAMLLTVLAGCAPTSGSASGTLEQAVAKSDAPFAILDLQTRAVTYATAVTDLATNPAYRDGKMVFRRVGPDGRRVLIGVFEVTQAQWHRLDGTRPWWGVPDGQDRSTTGGIDWSTTPVVVAASAQTDDRPAYGLDYDAIVLALVAYPLPDGARLTVPSAQQWTDAAGVASGYTWGSQPLRSQIAAQAVVAESVLSEANKTTRLISGSDVGGPDPVGTHLPSSTGIYDLHGNVWEWTSPGTAVRGGSWYDSVSLARVEVAAGAGQGLDSDVDHALIGARLVLIP